MNMMREPGLLRMGNRLSVYIKEHVRLAGVDQTEAATDLFDKIRQLFPTWILMTCPIIHPNLRYMSRNGKLIFGDTFQVRGDPGALYRNVHPADQADLQACLEHLHNFLFQVPPADHHQYRGVLHYRFLNPDGQYIYLHDEKAVISLSDTGNLYIALVRDITGEKSFAGVKLEIFDCAAAGCRISVFQPGNKRAMLTKRETDLVSLIKQGLSTKEIAWYLKISHHTVRNTKSRLFEKFRVNNTVELLNMTAN